MKKFFAVLLFLALPLSASAEIYKWIGAKGVVSFTDNPASIPEKQRKQAVIVDAAPPAVEEVIIESKDSSVKKSVDSSQKKGELAGNKKLYDGKDEAAWKREFEVAKAELEDVESQIADVEERLKKKDGMSRGEYQTLQNTLNILKIRHEKQKVKKSKVTDAAAAAGLSL